LTAWITRSAGAVLLTTAALTLGSALTKGTIAGRLIGAGVIIPRLGDRQTMREVLSFGLWNWLTGIGGLVFVHADRLLIGSWLGATPLSYYTVCTQLAQQIHALPAAAMSFLFPLISRKSQTSGREALRALRVYAVAFNVLISTVLAALLYVFAVPILTAWMGRTFAAEAGYVLHWLVIGFYLVSLNIAPHFLLLGGNGVRYVSITNVIGGLAGLAAAFVLLPVSGLLGAAQARLIMGTTTLANYWKLFNEPDAKP
jgi:O-antigen/teichoic acid export membrane protein